MSATLPGLVVATHGRQCLVELPNGERVLCQTRGKRSELVTGDTVRWARSGDGGVVEQLEPRRNLLHRQDAWRSKAFAANLDQVLFLVAVDPGFSDELVTRALVAADAAGITAILGLNKVDLPGAAAARERLAPYQAMGLTVLELALRAQPQASIHTLAPVLRGRRTLILGPSGMGKSSLVNLLVPEAEAAVGEISRALHSGRHTTTSTRWYWVPGLAGADGPALSQRHTAIIDSPGFQEFGLHHVSAQALAWHFADIRPLLGHCRFHNCSHVHEPGCGVQQATLSGALSPRRWQLYQHLLAELTGGGPG